jgi:hypothetical protein
MMAINRGVLASFQTVAPYLTGADLTEPLPRSWNRPPAPVVEGHARGAVPFQPRLIQGVHGRLPRITKLEFTVPYALFENDERLTRPFRTEREVWEAAEQADLVVAGTRGEKILDNNFEIKPCEATPEELAAMTRSEILFSERAPEETPPTNGSQGPKMAPPKIGTRERSS